MKDVNRRGRWPTGMGELVPDLLSDDESDNFQPAGVAAAAKKGRGDASRLDVPPRRRWQISTMPPIPRGHRAPPGAKPSTAAAWAAQVQLNSFVVVERAPKGRGLDLEIGSSSMGAGQPAKWCVRASSPVGF